MSTLDDGLRDGQEVLRFAFAGRQRYSDPLKESTIDDGIFDGQKCPPNTSGQPNCVVDTDTDGTPDLFDRDIDGDGVPNNLDSSPLRKSTPFTYRFHRQPGRHQGQHDSLAPLRYS